MYFVHKCVKKWEVFCYFPLKKTFIQVANIQDIFATNVIARDPYSDRFVELIDGNGCPVDPYVFPALGLSRYNTQ